MTFPPRLLIRPFEPTDGEAAGQLIRSIRRGEFGLPIAPEAPPDLADIPAFYQRGGGGFWVACEGSRLVGTLALLDLGDGDGALRRMYVEPGHRGPERGVALRLMTAAFDHARNHGVETVYLGTLETFKAACRFYEKHGWTGLPKADLPDRFPVLPLDTRFYRRSTAPFA